MVPWFVRVACEVEVRLKQTLEVSTWEGWSDTTDIATETANRASELVKIGNLLRLFSSSAGAELEFLKH